MKTNVIVYHAIKIEAEKVTDCPDGIVSAAYLAEYLGLENCEIVPQAYLHASEYENFEIPFDYEGRDIWIVDFCYPANVLKTIAEKAKTLNILDHHATAESAIKAVEKLPNVNAKYSPNEKDSGASLVYKFVKGLRDSDSNQLPKPIKNVWERDTGANGYYQAEIIDSRNFNTWLSAERKNKKDTQYEWLPKIHEMSEAEYLEAVKIGTELNKKDDELIEKEIQNWFSNPTYEVISGYEVPVINVENPRLISWMSAIFHQKLKMEVPFTAYKFENNYSLRKPVSSEIHCGEIAKLNGGGGHAAAAGFTKK